MQYTRGSLPAPKEPEEKTEPEEPKFEDVDQETLDKEFADEEVNLAFLNDEKSLNTSDEDPNNKKENMLIIEKLHRSKMNYLTKPQKM